MWGPIPTRYAGCHFRSRIEARWAVFMDHARVPWEYEPQGFTWDAQDRKHSSTYGVDYDLEGGRFLPDFWLPTLDTWLEIKGAEPSEEETRLCFELAIVTGQRVMLTFGEIPRDIDDRGYAFDFDGRVIHDMGHMWLDGGADYQYAWCRCPDCGKVGIEFEARGGRICGNESVRVHNADDPLLMYAYRAARSARFEHGESGAT